jgi:hypothetical protein
MNDSDIGYSYEWESDFLDWLKVNKKSNSTSNDLEIVEDYPEIKKNYSENFILQNFFDEN